MLRVVDAAVLPDVLQIGPSNLLERRHVSHVDREQIRVEHFQSMGQPNGELLVQEHGWNHQCALILGLQDMSAQGIHLLELCS